MYIHFPSRYLIHVVTIEVDGHPPGWGLGVEGRHTVRGGEVYIVVRVVRGVDNSNQLAGRGRALVQIGSVGVQKIAEAQKICRSSWQNYCSEQDKYLHSYIMRMLRTARFS